MVGRTIRDKYKCPESDYDYLEEPSILAILVLGIKMVGVDNFYKCHPPRTRTALPEGESNEEHNDDTDYVLKNIMMTQEPCKSSWKTPWKLLSTGAVSLAVQNVWNHTVIVIEFKIVGLETHNQWSS